MRILLALTVFAFACGSTTPKQQSSIVNEGSDLSPNCCCKTIPVTDEKDITPVYAMQGRMDCSAADGTCVDDVQCNGASDDMTAEPTEPSGTGLDGVPPPPDLGTDSSATP